MKQQYLIQRAIHQCIDHIVAHQKPDGSFRSISSNSKTMDGIRVYQDTNFHTAIIANSCRFVQNSAVKEMGQKAAHFLLNKMSSACTWNYWSEPEQHSGNTYPDDLDDTFAALATLQIYTPSSISGKHFVHIVELLCKQEKNIGGPYHTWIDGGTHADIDPAVNATIQFTLFLFDIKVNGLEHYIETVIDEENTSSIYYINTITTYYFISRFYRGHYTETIIERLKEKLNTTNDILHKSMCLSALIYYGVEKESLTPYVLEIAKAIQKGIPTESWYIEKKDSQGFWYSGSSPLTASFVLELLWNYYDNSYGEYLNETTSKNDFLSSLRHLLNEYNLIHTGLNPLQKSNILFETALLPYQLHKEINHCNSLDIHKEKVFYLCAAQAIGTITYNLYDQLIDNDELNIIHPDSVVFLRKAHRHFIKILHDYGPEIMQEDIKTLLERMDIATFEKNQRMAIHIEEDVVYIPKLKPNDIYDIADESIGVAIVPLCLYALHKKTQADRNSLLHFFKNYIRARQLHDDIHDWKHDLAHNKLNNVTLWCTEKLIERKQFIPESCIIYTSYKDAVQHLLYTEGIPYFAKEILTYTQKARAYSENSKTLEGLIRPLERGAERALIEYNRLQEFITIYNPIQ